MILDAGSVYVEVEWDEAGRLVLTRNGYLESYSWEDRITLNTEQVEGLKLFLLKGKPNEKS